MYNLIVVALLVVPAASLNASISTVGRHFLGNIRSRIVGGRKATIEDFPYQVSILNGRSFLCGGSVYRPDIIITAAHCLVNVNVRRIAVVAGTLDWCEGGVESPVDRFVQHSRFSPKTFDYDIAVLKLTIKLAYGPTIQPLKLPFFRQEFATGSLGIVSGWGALEEDGDEPDELHFTTLKTVNFGDCYQAYKGLHSVTKNMMCAWIKHGGYGTCQGDSGSALVIGDVMAGIVSWGLGCARPNVPEVYTKVSVLRKWLDHHVKTLTS